MKIRVPRNGTSVPSFLAFSNLPKSSNESIDFSSSFFNNNEQQTSSVFNVMSERKKKSRATDEDVTQNAEYLTRASPPEDFVDFFLSLCEEYDVSPLPQLSVTGCEEIVELRRASYKKLLSNRGKTSEERMASDSRVSTASSRTSASKKNSVLHPFATETRRTKGQVIARGNFHLQHLNLSYNHLKNEGLKKIVKCLFYQSYALLDDTSKGLLHVRLEGNDFEADKNENLDQIHEFLRNRISPKDNAKKEDAGAI